MNTTQKISSVLAALALSLSVAACNRSTNTTGTAEGPAEKAGKVIDQAARETAEAGREAANRTGEAIDRTLDNAAIRSQERRDEQNAMRTDELRTDDMLTDVELRAQSLIDSARGSVSQGDTPKARDFLAQLKEPETYDRLAIATKARVDQLEKDIDSGILSPTAVDR